MTPAPHIEDVLLRMVSRQGARYVLGAEAAWNAKDPRKLDCSELFEWTMRGLGVEFPDGAAQQWDFCRRKGTTVGVVEGLRTRGALLFRVKPGGGGGKGNHVVASLGDGRTFEARGARYGVNYFTASGRQWTGAARLPGVRYGPREHGGLPEISLPMRQGQRSEGIRFMQYLLIAVIAGGKGLVVDGVYGPKTAEAVWAYQKFRTAQGDVRLTVNGVVDGATWTSLVADFARKK